MGVGGVAARVIDTACAAQGWWLARGEHFSVTEFPDSCVYISESSSVNKCTFYCKYPALYYIVTVNCFYYYYFYIFPGLLSVVKVVL